MLTKRIRGFLIGLVMVFSTVASGVYAADAETVNINTADAQTIAQVLFGVGESKAKAIIAYRESNGAFQSAQQLAEVKGIGESIIEKNQNRIVLK